MQPPTQDLLMNIDCSTSRKCFLPFEVAHFQRKVVCVCVSVFACVCARNVWYELVGAGVK